MTNELIKYLFHKHLKLISFAIDNNYSQKDIYDTIYQLELQEPHKQDDCLIKALNELMLFIKKHLEIKRKLNPITQPHTSGYTMAVIAQNVAN